MNDAIYLAKILWSYNVLNQKIEKADCIIALGNSDIRTVQTAANLFKNGYGDILVTTGGFGRLTKDLFTKPEAQLFADEAIELGVPSDKIFIEDKSTNTFDNIKFTKKLLNEKGIIPKTILVVTKPYMERRAFATTLAVWKGVRVIVASADLDFNTYPNDTISSDLLVNMVVGDTQRLMIFSESGDVPRQDFPKEVVEAYNKLVEFGYTKQVIPKENIPNLLSTVTAGDAS
jgi:uncharacterized SAM-binding protein YcdF (DUF218 family)